MSASESGIFRESGISYVRFPASDPQSTARSYREVFGWKMDLDRPDPSFEDGTGHVIGHISAEHEAAGEAGIRPYVYVESVDDTLAAVSGNGGRVVTQPYSE